MIDMKQKPIKVRDVYYGKDHKLMIETLEGKLMEADLELNYEIESDG